MNYCITGKRPRKYHGIGRRLRAYISPTFYRHGSAESKDLRAFYSFRVTLARPEAGHTSLTPREREVLAWVAQGKSAEEVAEILHIAKRTVDEHVQTAVRKLGALNRTHAVAIAVQDGIIEV
jgi:DNA-binding CsgD family transcriptional regulator